MTFLLLLISCGSEIPSTTTNPVDKLAGYEDVRLGRALEDVPGLERLPKDDVYAMKETAYTRPADDTMYTPPGGEVVHTEGPPVYVIRDGVVRSIKLRVIDDVRIDYATDKMTKESRFDCTVLLYNLNKTLGKPSTEVDSAGTNYTWLGDLSKISVLVMDGTEGDKNCFLRTRML